MHHWEQPHTACIPPSFFGQAPSSQSGDDLAWGAAIRARTAKACFALWAVIPAHVGGGDFMENPANSLELTFNEKEKNKEPEEMVCFELRHSPVKAPI